MPECNFSFLWGLKDDDTKVIDNENKDKLTEALFVPMFKSDAIKLSNHIYEYLWSGKWG